jgi:hypothetical protein
MYMPIEYRIDSAQKVVFAKAKGRLTDEDVFGYQQQVWSDPSVAGFNELVDMSEVEEIVPPSTERVRFLANTSAEMDDPDRPSRFAIVAPQDLAFGLGRMYGAYRELSPGSTKQVAIFRTKKAALSWLGVQEQNLD